IGKDTSEYWTTRWQEGGTGVPKSHLSDSTQVLSTLGIETIRKRVRLIQMLDAAERLGIAPLRAARLHGFAYLADVLSPVWHLPAFDGKILKIEGGPHY